MLLIIFIGPDEAADAVYKTPPFISDTAPNIDSSASFNHLYHRNKYKSMTMTSSSLNKKRTYILCPNNLKSRLKQKISIMLNINYFFDELLKSFLHAQEPITTEVVGKINQ